MVLQARRTPTMQNPCGAIWRQWSRARLRDELRLIQEDNRSANVRFYTFNDSDLVAMHKYCIKLLNLQRLNHVGVDLQ
jgi:hypothetical protein